MVGFKTAHFMSVPKQLQLPAQLSLLQLDAHMNIVSCQDLFHWIWEHPRCYLFS